MQREIQNPAFCKSNYSLELFPKDITMFDRDINTIELLNISGLSICICLDSEYPRAHNIL